MGTENKRSNNQSEISCHLMPHSSLILSRKEMFGNIATKEEKCIYSLKMKFMARKRK